MPGEGIGPVGSVTSQTGDQIDVLYDGLNKFVGIRNSDQIMIFNESEARQVIGLMQEALTLTEDRMV